MNRILPFLTAGTDGAYSMPPTKRPVRPKSKARSSGSRTAGANNDVLAFRPKPVTHPNALRALHIPINRACKIQVELIGEGWQDMAPEVMDFIMAAEWKVSVVGEPEPEAGKAAGQ